MSISSHSTRAKSIGSTGFLASLPKELLGILLSFEALFVLFLLSGNYKGLPRFAWVPVDLTALFFVLSILAGGVLILHGWIYRSSFLITAAGLYFVGWIAVTYAWTPSRYYGTQKVLQVVTLVYWAFFAVVHIIAADRKRTYRFLILLVLFAIWLAAETFIAYLHLSSDSFAKALGGTYLSLNRTCSTAALIVLVAFLFTARSLMQRVVLMGVFFGLSYVLLISGGRGPLLAMLVAAALPLVVGWRLSATSLLISRFQLRLLPVVLIAVLGFLYLVMTGELPRTLNRLTALADLESGSAGDRLVRYAAALELWQQAPLVGHGVGSWTLMYGISSSDDRSYPHNMFLELLVETGIVGVVLLLVLVVTALRTAKPARLRRDPLLLCSLMLFINAFLNAMVSGDLTDNRAMFAMLGLMTLRLERPRERPSGETQMVDRSRDEAAGGGRSLAGGERSDPVRVADGQNGFSSAESWETSPASGPASPRHDEVRCPSGLTTDPAVGENHRRWLEGFLEGEISSLSARVEELERRLRRRTIILVGMVSFGALSATTSIGIAVVRFFEPPWAGQTGAAIYPPESSRAGPRPTAQVLNRARDAQSKETDGTDGVASGTSPAAPSQEVTGPAVVGAREPADSASAGSEGPDPEPPEGPGPTSGERDGGSSDPSASLQTVEDGPTLDTAPVPGSGPFAPRGGSADAPGPAWVASGIGGSSPGATTGATERPVIPDSPAPAGAPAPSAAVSKPSAVPPARAAGAPPPSGRFAVYFFSVRPPARVAGEWRRLLERHPEALADLEPRALRPVEVPGKGTFYAVEAGAFATRIEAQAVCNRLRSQGQSCKVLAP